MPIYAYQCAACGHDFDRLQKLSDPDPDACPACGAEGEVKRQLTAPSFRLAGSGWYETDFKKDGDKKRNLVEKAEGAGKTDGGTDKTASGDKGAGGDKADKPAAKTETPAAKPAAKPDAAPAKTAKPAPSGS